MFYTNDSSYALSTQVEQSKVGFRSDIQVHVIGNWVRVMCNVNY